MPAQRLRGTSGVLSVKHLLGSTDIYWMDLLPYLPPALALGVFAFVFYRISRTIRMFTNPKLLTEWLANHLESSLEKQNLSPEQIERVREQLKKGLTSRADGDSTGGLPGGFARMIVENTLDAEDELPSTSTAKADAIDPSTYGQTQLPSGLRRPGSFEGIRSPGLRFGVCLLMTAAAYALYKFF